MQTFENALMRLNRGALVLLLAAMAVIIFANVVLRYTTSESIEWAEEVARYLMVWLTFLGAGPVLRYGGHIAVENLQDALPPRAAVALRALIASMLFAFFGFMVWFGLLYVERAQYQMTPTTQISMSWVYAAIPVGGLLLALHLALVLRGYVGERRMAADDHFDANASASL
ncbi:TRAP transporter small permease [Ideonella sp. 4Y16]|uniref:TRAP transporter small permease protein n=1 Tax=Ideonella alba TaxID=2824118 RepID=A0A940Y8F5_9BURK|nr:TRAP transporter small permease [Ideonella alba]MBQ0931822.1 TRAP transporter small permease [Ideonella alba]MBQ0941735.1 TRAP transporter small permease [Ideonella alba]